MNTKPKVHLSVEHFYELYENVPEKYELIDGQPVLKFGEPDMMAGGSAVHNMVSGNIFFALKQKLKGSTCKPFGPDMGLKTKFDAVFYPDVAIYCDRRDLDRDTALAQDFSHPSVLFEVLSPSTKRYDRGEKLVRYQEIQSVNAVLLVDPITRHITLHNRTSPKSWTMRELEADEDVVLIEPALVLTRTEIFDLT
jgi:Uma2 family endonuclease